ncbi:hypothetical protein BHU72_10025 [Desulfuribacillus stibiiarsenatis]|uniref:Uncharacterized protein n=2 Tax=Desulfuribacillus stibiiarsenatis TaxID=1390249 RepID=A0A1E5L9B8_9FIRM|nr:hypothetical protein BHU72_10025 [Desulfuribacillus stibiiarsenatis]
MVCRNVIYANAGKSKQIANRKEIERKLIVSMKSIAFMVIRVLSICFIVLGFRYLGNVVTISLPSFMGMYDPNFNRILASLSIPVIVVFVFGIILWIFAERISSYLVLKEAKEEPTNIDIEKIEPIAYSILGVLLLVFSIPEQIRYISQIAMMDKEFMNIPQIHWPIYSSIVVEAIKIMLGLLLLLQANSIKKLVKKLREIGT